MYICHVKKQNIWSDSENILMRLFLTSSHIASQLNITQHLCHVYHVTPMGNVWERHGGWPPPLPFCVNNGWHQSHNI